MLNMYLMIFDISSKYWVRFSQYFAKIHEYIAYFRLWEPFNQLWAKIVLTLPQEIAEIVEYESENDLIFLVSRY